MPYIHKLTSSSTIISAIIRTFKPQGSSWITEAIEDIGWAIQGIGYHAGLEPFSTEPPYLKVANNRVKIPCEVERIIVVEQLVPLTLTSNVLNVDGTTPPPSTTSDPCDFRSVKLLLGSDLTSYGLSARSPRTTFIQPNTPYYDLNTDYVITSFTDGLIKLHGVRFSLDNDGLPNILDDFDYKEACKWYCFQNMILKGYKHPEVDFKGAFQMWEMYRLRAENAPKVPSIDGADRFRAGWNRFAPNVELSGDFFMNMEQTNFKG